MHYFKFQKNIVVFIALLCASVSSFAGSYRDFFRAIQFDNVRVVQSLLQRGFDPNTVNPDGVPALMLAVREPALKVAELLASQPATQTEVRNAQDESVLMLAALQGYLPLVQKLVANNADVNKTGWAALHYAASGGHVEVVAFLLDKYAYIDAESPNGTTPLMMAARYGSPEAVKHLIQAGADVRLKNKLGLTALDFAVAGQRPDAQQLIGSAIERRGQSAASLPPLQNLPVVQNTPVQPVTPVPSVTAAPVRPTARPVPAMVSVPLVPSMPTRAEPAKPLLPMPPATGGKPAYTTPIR